jgi:CHAT domain-containing protein
VVAAGRIDGSCASNRASLERDALALESNPANVAAATRLGSALDPPGHDGERLDVLLVGPIARTPLAALRDRDGLIIARRPLVRVLGLIGSPRGPWRPGAVVIGAPTSTLPGALDETRRLAARFRVTALLGADASRAALASSRGLELVHVAAHAMVRRNGPVLELHDGGLSLPEIAGLQPAARVVVLATCDSATARDEGGWGSLASAFLIGGADAVVATSWRVSDAEVPRLMDRFYAAGGATDPARGLATAQATLANELPARTWAAFAVIAAPPSLR